jgi:hypothetical protein
MIPQTTPLYATDLGSRTLSTYLVVGWVQATAAWVLFPVLAPLAGGTERVQAWLPPASERLSYSAERPAPRDPRSDETEIIQRVRS